MFPPFVENVGDSFFMPSAMQRTHLLVSIRSKTEVEPALAGGVDLIDIKEPKRGSLGRPTDNVIAGIVEQVAGRRPISAALGELRDTSSAPAAIAHLDFLKWGLAGCCPDFEWRSALNSLRRMVTEVSAQTNVVTVAYADWQTAQAPSVDSVVAFACERRGNVMLIDTFEKSTGNNLLTWLSVEKLESICRSCRQSGVKIALAGSLGLAEIADLKYLQPDWFAVRGAVCQAGRDSHVNEEKVRGLYQLLTK